MSAPVCGCEHGLNCTKTTVCAVDAALEDQAFEHEHGMLNAKVMSTQCKATVYDTWSVRDRRCGNNVSSDGFCGVHHPDKIKARQEKQAARDEEYRKMSCTYKLGKALEKAEKLEKGITDFLEGNYSHPRTFRPQQCPHDQYYYEDCGQCDEAHFTAVLKQLERDNE